MARGKKAPLPAPRPSWEAPALLALLFGLVFLLQAGSLRLAWADWGNVDAFLSLRGWAGLRSLLLNDWNGAPSFQVLGWLLAAGLTKLFGTWAPGHFAFLLPAHLAVSLLVLGTLRARGWSETGARGAAALCLLAPTAPASLGTMNNALFVWPCAGLALLAYLLARPLAGRADLAALCAAALFAQFTGNQTVLAAPLLLAMSARAHGRRALVPLALSALTGAAYWALAVRPHAAAVAPRADWTLAAGALAETAGRHLEALDPSSWMYGRLSLGPSSATLAVAVLAAAVCWRLLPEEDGAPRASDSPAPLLALLAAVVLPILSVRMSGYRAWVDPRYTYVTGLLVAVLCARLLEAAPGPLRRLGLAAALAWCGFLSVYSLRDIWGGVKKLDGRLWAEVDARLAENPRARYFVYDGPTPRALMPLLAAAEGDFLEEFGARYRLKVTRGVSLELAPRPPAEGPGVVAVQPFGRPPVMVSRDEVAVLAVRHGPSFQDLLSARARFFPRYDEYRAWMKAGGDL